MGLNLCVTFANTDASKFIKVVSRAIETLNSRYNDEDAILVDHFLANDASAFQRIYEKYYDKVLRIATGILFDREESADATQEVFALVYKNIPRFNRQSKFSTWLYRIAVNQSIQHARKLKFKKKDVALTEAASSEHEIDSPVIESESIQVALQALSPQDRALLTLYYWEEWNLSDIAASIGCNMNAAKTRLFRARDRFKKLYQRGEL
jgi:RNA polymerase sigma-70 factor (ECF subfamily)